MCGLQLTSVQLTSVFVIRERQGIVPIACWAGFRVCWLHEALAVTYLSVFSPSPRLPYLPHPHANNCKQHVTTVLLITM